MRQQHLLPRHYGPLRSRPSPLRRIRVRVALIPATEHNEYRPGDRMSRIPPAAPSLPASALLVGLGRLRAARKLLAL